MRSNESKLIATTEDLKKAEDKIKILEEQNRDTKIENENLKKENSDLKSEVTRNKAYFEGCTARKHPKNKTVVKNYINSPKLSNIDVTNIQPLTKEILKKEIKNYTYEPFKMGEMGLADFIVSLAKDESDIVPKFNYACTDTDRKHFYRLTEDKRWEKDADGHYILNIFNELRDPVGEYYNYFLNTEKEEMRREASKKIHPELGRVDLVLTDDLIMRITSEISPIHTGLHLNNRRSKGELKNKVKKELVKRLAI